MNHPATYFEQPHKYNKKVRSNAVPWCQVLDSFRLFFLSFFLFFFFFVVVVVNAYKISILKIRQVKGEEEMG